MAETTVKKSKEIEPVRPEGVLSTLRDEMDRVFDRLTRSFSGMPSIRRAFDFEPEFRWSSMLDVQVPAVDISETDTGFRITAELPGMKKEDIEISVAQGLLTIKGEKREAREEKEKGYYLSERRFGTFQRSFQLPSQADADRIEAKFDNGVLTLTLPKSAEALKSEKKIKIA
ncbi:MAG TPA: Hsp20/alpha crystallin family protein [Alphaproteobacteria bacterium]|nr:Hsp20/alpha crystallin family protein [Alphaproteobacteria bacterium]